MRLAPRVLVALLLCVPGGAYAQGAIFPVRTGSVALTASPHGAIREACALCHAATAWKPARISDAFRHAPGVFPLDGAHARTACASCHKNLDYTKASTSCISCHADVHKGELGTECARCHSVRSFAETPSMRRAHEMTRFPLRGAHATLNCESCHTPSSPGQMQFVNKPTACFGCHAAAFRATKAPDHQAAGFSQDCTTCHNILSWNGAKYDHAATRFPLTGAHAAVTCDGCHANRIYRGKSMDCVSCHRADYDKATNPAHAPGFPTTCTDCHATATWTGAKFDHSLTRWPLTGAHVAVSCTSCHADKVYRGKTTECSGCHQADFAKTRAPPHVAAGFPNTCSSCHSTAAWLGAVFDHSTTRFPLTGGHAAAACSSCHGDGVYHGKPLTCVACHQTDFDNSRNPPHTSAGFPNTCETCHTTTRWLGAVFNHNATAFPLTGMHATTACTACHGDGVYKGKPATCVSCHTNEYNGTKDPPHAAAGFANTCATCHTTSSWLGAVFDHATTTFPLTGAHLTTTCVSCHGNGVYHGKPTTCASCHQNDFSNSKNPPHTAAGFPNTCETCHTTTRWLGAVFNHSATAFPLTGKHLTATCSSCHGDGVYKGKPTACTACHQTDYNNTKNPPHVSAGFSTTCTTCHNTTQWLGAVFNHSATAFPLTGAHLAVACNQCHGDGVYKGKPAACVACHQTDYNAATNPPHAAAGFPTTCNTCHTTTRWPGATFDHNATTFPLTGKHMTTPCSGCHGDGVYKGKPTDCYSCHRTDYTSTTNPNHTAAGFPTTCAACHTTTVWTGAVFNHDASWFPIYSGKHKGKWSTCADCHTSPTNFAVFTCITCHTKSKTDQEHQGRQGYKYDSNACYSCHPRGSGG